MFGRKSKTKTKGCSNKTSQMEAGMDMNSKNSKSKMNSKK